MQAISTVKVTVRLAGSSRRMGGVYGHLEYWVNIRLVASCWSLSLHPKFFNYLNTA